MDLLFVDGVCFLGGREIAISKVRRDGCGPLALQNDFEGQHRDEVSGQAPPSRRKVLGIGDSCP
jgi:hypothetical protein